MMSRTLPRHRCTSSPSGHLVKLPPTSSFPHDKKRSVLWNGKFSSVFSSCLLLKEKVLFFKFIFYLSVFLSEYFWCFHQSCDKCPYTFCFYTGINTIWLDALVANQQTIGVNEHSKDVRRTQEQRPESSSLTPTWHTRYMTR